MNRHLSIVSILLLIFYMGWFMWEQKELIQEQRIYIEHIEKELIARKFMLGEYSLENLRLNQDTSPIHRPPI